MILGAVGQELERDVTTQAHIRGTVDVAHAAARQQFDDPIRADQPIRAEQRIVAGEIARCQHQRRGFEKARQPCAGGGECVGLGGEFRVFDDELGAQPFLSLWTGNQPCVMPGGEQAPVLGAHVNPAADESPSACWSQARAVFQS